MRRPSALLVPAVVILLVAGLVEGAPTSPQGGLGRGDEVPLAFGLFGAIAIASAAAWRFPSSGALAAALAAAALGTLASVEHSPGVAVGITALVAAPAAVVWAWSGRERPARAVAAVLVSAGLVAVSGYGASRLHALLGPTQPTSTSVLEPVDLVTWAWAGATTESSVTVNAELARDGAVVRLLVADRADDLARARRSEATSARSGAVVSLSVDGLRPGTRYHYAVEVDGVLDRGRRGQVETFPAGPSSFTIATGSCAWTGSNGRVFDTIRDLDPLVFIHTGDLHYENLGRDDEPAFRDAYRQVLGSPAQSLLYRSTTVAYVWDDHDYGRNDSDGGSPSRPAARAAYRDVVPHYPLADGPTGTIQQAFTVGRVRVLLLDTRSARSPRRAPDDADKTMLGTEQRAWLARELADAGDRFPLVLLVSPVPWIAAPASASDTWGGYAVERRAVADLVASSGVRGVVMLSGDGHMLAIDDGSHSAYATGGGPGFPVLHAGALDRPGKIKGGPYSEGVHPGGGQFGVVRVEDDGGPNLTVTLSGKDWRGRTLLQHHVVMPAA